MYKFCDVQMLPTKFLVLGCQKLIVIFFININDFNTEKLFYCSRGGQFTRAQIRGDDSAGRSQIRGGGGRGNQDGRSQEISEISAPNPSSQR